MQIADAARAIRHVFLRDLVVDASIGIYPHEQRTRQRVRLNVDLGVDEDPAPLLDRLDHVVDYEVLVNRIRAIATGSHINLVETLAERIAAACLEERRVRSARIRVEKLDVFADAVAAGVEIERLRPADRPPLPESH